MDIYNPHPKQNRRWFLKLSILGAGGVAAAGWWGWRRGAIDPERGAAFAAWEQWQAGEDPQLRLVSAAVLAPSKHNSQPWQFRVQPGYIDLFVEPPRTVGALDPLHREAYFGAGCCLTNFLLAAEVEGLKATPTYLPDREFLWNWVAKIDLEPGPQIRNPLYKAIPNRHTNRGPYDAARAVTPAILEDLARTGSPDGCIQVTWLDREQQKAFAALTLDATKAILADQDQARDGAVWYRTNWNAVQTEADGITLDAAGFPPRELLKNKILAAPSPVEFDANWLSNTTMQVASMPATGILTVSNGREPLNDIAAGVAWQRMALRATTLGLVMQPLTQTIERADREIATAATDPRFGNALREIVSDAGDPIFAFRVGYPTVPSVASPRRGVEQVVYTKEKKKKKRFTFRL
jgi:nitroreductase